MPDHDLVALWVPHEELIGTLELLTAAQANRVTRAEA